MLKNVWADFQTIIELFTQKIVIKLSKIWVWDPRSAIRKKSIPDPGSRSKRHRIPDPDPQHWFFQLDQQQTCQSHCHWIRYGFGTRRVKSPRILADLKVKPKDIAKQVVRNWYLMVEVVVQAVLLAEGPHLRAGKEPVHLAPGLAIKNPPKKTQKKPPKKNQKKTT